MAEPNPFSRLLESKSTQRIGVRVKLMKIEARLIIKVVTANGRKKSPTIEDIIAFHAAFEQIHPFQDGNGRVGRLIALKECLRFNIVPFLIEDNKKAFYYRGLSEWENEKGWLTDTCLDGQDTFKRLLATFEL